MSTTRSQKRRNNLQESSKNVSEGLISPVVVENQNFLEQGASTMGPSNVKSPRIENSVLESLRPSLIEEITSKIKRLLIESQKEMMKFLRPKTGECTMEEDENDREKDTRSFYTPTKSVRIKSTHDTSTSRNNKLANTNWLKLLIGF